MLKYRINTRDFWDKQNSIKIERYEVEHLYGKEGEEHELFVCYYEDEDIVINEGDKLLVNSNFVINNSDDNEDATGGRLFNLIDTFVVDSVSKEDKSFNLLIDKYVRLSPSVINAQIIDGEKYIYFYFYDTHFFSRFTKESFLFNEDNTVNEDFEDLENHKVSLFIDYVNVLGENYSIDLDLDYINSTTLRISLTDFKDVIDDLETEDKNITDLLFSGKISYDDFCDENYDGGNLLLDFSNIVTYRNNFWFEESDDITVYVDKPIYSLNIPFSQQFETNLMQSMEIQENFVDAETRKSINPINDMEKDLYHPVIKKSSGGYDEVYEIVFNLHFRQHRGDDWLVDNDALWNGIVKTENSYEFMNPITSEEKPFFSYKEKEFQSDLLSYLNFTNNDVRYQKNKLKKSFIRIMFYDSMNESNHNLLSYSTLFLDSGHLFGKYAKQFETKGYSFINYDKDGKYESEKLDVVGIRVNREPEKSYYNKDKDEVEDMRLSCQFRVSGKYTSNKSSEGFYIYLWKDNYTTLPMDIYMRVEFNHAGYGRTIPFMMPYDRENHNKIKDFDTILSDHTKTDGGYGMKEYLRYSYIHFKYLYDINKKCYVYYLDTDEFYSGTAKNTANNTITLNLYEAKISPKDNGYAEITH